MSWGEFYVRRVVLGRVVFGATCPDSLTNTRFDLVDVLQKFACQPIETTEKHFRFLLARRSKQSPNREMFVKDFKKEFYDVIQHQVLKTNCFHIESPQSPISAIAQSEICKKSVNDKFTLFEKAF